MLKIMFGDLGWDAKGKISYVSDYFNAEYEQTWFQSDLAKDIVKGVDDTTYIAGEYFESPVFGGISPRDLSTGCKALLLLLNEDNIIVSGDRMGDNCAPYLLRIAEEKDIVITLSHIMKFPWPAKIWSVNSERFLRDEVDYVEEEIMCKL